MKPVSTRTYSFVALSVLTAIPVLGLGSAEAQRYGAEVRSWHDRTLTATARDASWQIARVVETRTRDLEALASSIEVLSNVTSSLATRLMQRHWESGGRFTGMYLADAEANVISRAVPPGTPTPAVNYSDRDYYAELVRTRRTAISRVQSGKVIDAPNVQLATPIFATSGKLLGYVEGSVSLDPIADVVSRRAAELDGSRLVVLDDQGRVIADSDRIGSVPLQDAASVALLSAADPPELTTGLDDRGVAARAATRRLPSPLQGWRVVALESQARIDGIASAAQRRTWAATLLALLVALGLSALIAHWTGQRLRTITAALKAVGRGDFSQRRPRPHPWEPREVHDAMTQFDSMSSQIERHTSELEHLVSERTQELAAVNERLETLVQALEHAEDGIEITAPDGKYLYVNPAMERITGYAAHELIGNYPSLLRSGTLDESFYRDIEAQYRAGHVFSGTFVGKRKDGTLFDQELTVWPIQDEAGTITHAVALRRDVSERKRTEQALRVSERMASVGTLAAGVAHEINNPLTYVLLSLTQIDRQLSRHSADLPLDFLGAVKKSTSYAVEGAERVQAIVKDLRSFSRADDDTVECVDVNSVLDSALRMVGADLRHRASVERSRGVVPHVACNPAQLSQVVLNLLTNAMQSFDPESDRPKTIHIATGTDDSGRVFIDVTDTGRGIAKEHEGRIFDPFFTTKPVGEGTGLGLSMVHGLITSMGGNVSVESQVDVGTTFRVMLPAAPGAMGHPTTEPFRPRRARPCRVLVIDDDEAVGQSLAVALERHAVTVATSAEDGLQRLRNEPYDIVLCDVMMPAMTGADFYEAVLAEHPELVARIIFITGGALSADAKRLFDEPGVLHLTKPLDERTVEVAMAQRLAATEEPSAARRSS